MADVLLFHTPDGGEIRIEAGRVEMTDGIETAAYLSLFGGNEDDSGIQGDDPKEWWANKLETSPARKYRSETQYVLRSLPAIPANLRRIEDAAGRDLAWMAESVASGISVVATIPRLNWVRIEIEIVLQDGRRVPMTFEFTRGQEGS
jgi:phage gp46-like protein